MNYRLSVYIFSVESLPTSSQLRVMNADEDHIFSADDFATADVDPKDEDYHPPDSLVWRRLTENRGNNSKYSLKSRVRVILQSCQASLYTDIIITDSSNVDFFIGSQ